MLSLMTQLSLIVAVSLVVAATQSVIAQQSHGTTTRPMYHFPRWSPDGKSIVVVGMSSPGSKVLLLSPMGGKTVTIPTGRIEPMAADWTAAGRIILIGDDPGGWYTIDRDGSNRRP